MNDVKILKVLKGGSLASTSIVNEMGVLKVRKEASSGHDYPFRKLNEQIDWLSKNQRYVPRIPKILDAGISEGKLRLDLEFYESTDFFDFIHDYPMAKSKRIISEILNFCFNYLYKDEEANKDQKLRELIQKKLIGKTNEAFADSPVLRNLQKYDNIVINGEKFPNIKTFINLANNSKIFDSLRKMRTATIHGDLTIDNIIVIPSFDFVLLDPNPDNIFNTPLVDVAKMFQSLHSGYEFLLGCEKCKVEKNNIEFEVEISKQYRHLYNYMLLEIRKYLTKEEFDNLLFFEALNYSRMLPLKNKINPDTVPVYYAVLVQLLNDFCSRKENDQGNYI